MRKIFAGVSALLVLLPMLSLAACKKREQRCAYSIRAEYCSGERSLEGEMTVTVPNNTENALEKLPFVLYANAFREGAEGQPVSEVYVPAVFYRGTSYGGMEIGEVQGGAWQVDGELLVVTLPEPLYPDECVTLSVKYSLTLPEANFRFGAGEHCVNLSSFYPQLLAEKENGFYDYASAPFGDPFVFDAADFEVELTVEEGLVAAFAGEGEGVTENGKTVYRVRAEGVRDMAFVLGALQKTAVEREGVSVEYYYFADGAPGETVKTAADALAIFARLFGDYPRRRYAFAETDLTFGGMEYDGFTMLSSSLTGGERTAAVVHETAHLWWRGLVGSDQDGCAFQDEGLAEYSVALFFENAEGYGGSYREEVESSERAYRSYYSVKSQLSPTVDTGMTRRLNEYSGDYEYRILAYDKGVILFDRLRQTMGDKKFFAALKDYAGKNRGRVATLSDLLSAFSSQEEVILSFTEGRCVI